MSRRTFILLLLHSIPWMLLSVSTMPIKGPRYQFFLFILSLSRVRIQPQKPLGDTVEICQPQALCSKVAWAKHLCWCLLTVCASCLVIAYLSLLIWQASENFWKAHKCISVLSPWKMFYDCRFLEDVADDEVEIQQSRFIHLVIRRKINVLLTLISWLIWKQVYQTAGVVFVFFADEDYRTKEFPTSKAKFYRSVWWHNKEKSWIHTFTKL